MNSCVVYQSVNVFFCIFFLITMKQVYVALYNDISRYSNIINKNDLIDESRQKCQFQKNEILKKSVIKWYYFVLSIKRNG